MLKKEEGVRGECTRYTVSRFHVIFHSHFCV
jgi:hypothetical protein